MSDVTIMNNEGRFEAMKIKLQVESIGGFSGHSDRRQIINYLTRIRPRPDQVVVCHGEKSKCFGMANYLEKRGIKTVVPSVMETFRVL